MPYTRRHTFNNPEREDYMAYPSKPSGPPMDLANMRHNGVRSLLVTCKQCRVARVVNVDSFDGALTVPSFGPRMVCKACGSKGADVRPNWTERPVIIPKP